MFIQDLAYRNKNRLYRYQRGTTTKATATTITTTTTTA